MTRVTVLLSRGIGIFMVVLVSAIMLRGMPVVTATVSDGPVMFGPLPVTVTLLGWLIFLKGLVLLLAPAETLVRAIGQMRYGDHFYLYLAPSLAVGLYLTWAGFTTPMRER